MQSPPGFSSEPRVSGSLCSNNTIRSPRERARPVPRQYLLLQCYNCRVHETETETETACSCSLRTQRPGWLRSGRTGGIDSATFCTSWAMSYLGKLPVRVSDKTRCERDLGQEWRSSQTATPGKGMTEIVTDSARSRIREVGMSLQSMTCFDVVDDYKLVRLNEESVAKMLEMSWYPNEQEEN